MSTNNPSCKSAALESSVKPSLDKIQEPLTQDAKLLRTNDSLCSVCHRTIDSG